LFDNFLARPTLAQPARNHSPHAQNGRVRIISKNLAVDFKANLNARGHISA
jgi:hypothetical protein